VKGENISLSLYSGAFQSAGYESARRSRRPASKAVAGPALSELPGAWTFARILALAFGPVPACNGFNEPGEPTSERRSAEMVGFSTFKLQSFLSTECNQRKCAAQVLERSRLCQGQANHRRQRCCGCQRPSKNSGTHFLKGMTHCGLGADQRSCANIQKPYHQLFVDHWDPDLRGTLLSVSGVLSDTVSRFLSREEAFNKLTFESKYRSHDE
jgi:hypothetical protein